MHNYDGTLELCHQSSDHMVENNNNTNISSSTPHTDWYLTPFETSYRFFGKNLVNHWSDFHWNIHLHHHNILCTFLGDECDCVMTYICNEPKTQGYCIKLIMTFRQIHYLKIDAHCTLMEQYIYSPRNYKIINCKYSWIFSLKKL